MEKKKCTGVFSRSKLTNDVRVSHQNTPDFGFGEFFPKKNNFIYSPSVQMYDRTMVQAGQAS